MPSGPGQVLPHLLKAYISSWTETGSLRDAVDCGSLSHLPMMVVWPRFPVCTSGILLNGCCC